MEVAYNKQIQDESYQSTPRLNVSKEDKNEKTYREVKNIYYAFESAQKKMKVLEEGSSEHKLQTLIAKRLLEDMIETSYHGKSDFKNQGAPMTDFLVNHGDYLTRLSDELKISTEKSALIEIALQAKKNTPVHLRPNPGFENQGTYKDIKILYSSLVNLKNDLDNNIGKMSVREIQTQKDAIKELTKTIIIKATQGTIDSHSKRGGMPIPIILVKNKEFFESLSEEYMSSEVEHLSSEDKPYTVKQLYKVALESEKTKVEQRLNEVTKIIQNYTGKCQTNLFPKGEIISEGKLYELRYKYKNSSGKYIKGDKQGWFRSWVNFKKKDDGHYRGDTYLGALVADRLTNGPVKEYLKSLELEIEPQLITERLMFPLGANNSIEDPGFTRAGESNLKNIRDSEDFIKVGMKICTFDFLTETSQVIFPSHMTHMNCFINNESVQNCKVNNDFKDLILEINNCKDIFRKINHYDTTSEKREELLSNLQPSMLEIQNKLKSLLNCEDQKTLSAFLAANKDYMKNITKAICNEQELINKIDILSSGYDIPLNPGNNTKENHNKKINKATAFNEAVRCIKDLYIKTSTCKTNVIFEAEEHMKESKILSMLDKSSQKKIKIINHEKLKAFIEKNNRFDKVISSTPDIIATTIMNDPVLNFSDEEKLCLIDMVIEGVKDENLRIKIIDNIRFSENLFSEKESYEHVEATRSELTESHLNTTFASSGITSGNDHTLISDTIRVANEELHGKLKNDDDSIKSFRQMYEDNDKNKSRYSIQKSLFRDSSRQDQINNLDKHLLNVFSNRSNSGEALKQLEEQIDKTMNEIESKKQEKTSALYEVCTHVKQQIEDYKISLKEKEEARPSKNSM